MLLVKTIVKPSAISGMGLFADEDIEKGRKIWQYSPNTCLLITRQQLQTLTQSAQHEELTKYYLTYGFYISQLKGLAILLDNSRFFNHSTDPNSGQSANSDEAWKNSVALRFIAKGEELTENYNTYDSIDWVKTFHQTFKVFDAYNQEDEKIDQEKGFKH